MSSPALFARPATERRSSRLPGGFDQEEEEEEDLASPGSVDDDPQLLNSFLPGPRDPSSLLPQTPEGPTQVRANMTLDESAMNHQLLDLESSFAPEPSNLVGHDSQLAGADDTHLFGMPNDNIAMRKKSHPPPHPLKIAHSAEELENENENERGLDGADGAPSPHSSPGGYKTPAPEEQDFHDTDDGEGITPHLPNTSVLETMSSSPTAAAAARTLSRVQSLATMGGYETAHERDEDAPTAKTSSHPRGDDDEDRDLDVDHAHEGPHGPTSGHQHHPSGSRRPRYLHKRSSQARLSYDSMASSNTDTSETTLGADFALQSGGALPDATSQRKPRSTISRQASLGSMMSGVSGISDDESRAQRQPSATDLSTLEEESPQSAKTGGGLLTPRASTFHMSLPTDTVITKNVRDLQVPGTFARQYREDRSVSPVKTDALGGLTPGPKRGLTLKEHRSTVEKLGKENFDLKMKIHFLDQALQKRSEDGVKEMITENVQLKSDRVRLEKDNHTLRKQVKDLKAKLDEAGARASPGADPGYATDEERSPTAEEEVLFLRERVEVNEIEIEKLRADNEAREAERRRLADMVRSLGDTRAAASDVGSREERDMWKDMLEAETIAREQSEEDNKRLREEIARVKREHAVAGKAGSRKARVGGSLVSRSNSAEAVHAQHVETERLRHEVSELQKMIGAQASTLTSRNKEKERLYQEIEDLKLGRLGGLRSVAGDSILDRSASRARSHSRASNGTRLSRLSDQERDELENRINQLRDEVSQLKLENQTLQSQFDEALAELDAVDAQAQADADQFNEELHLLTQERDNAIRDADEQDQAFQQLKTEAQEEIDGLGDELDARAEQCARLEQELKTQIEYAKTLHDEMRSATEGLARLEEDAQRNLARYQSVKADLDAANREVEELEKNCADAEANVQRLTVRQENSDNQIAFLHEEQDGDKIKIGDLESLLKKVHLNLESEREKSRDLERRIAEERAQRDAVTSREKQDVQRVINDLNREAAGAKDELRRTRKALSSHEIETTTYKERLGELEESLRHIVGDAHGSRSSLISTVTKMRRELDQATVDLDAVRRRLAETEGLLGDRDTLLESSSHECKKLADALERERAGRRQDKLDFERTNKGHNSTTRALTNASARIAELEGLRQTERKRFGQAESQVKDQLAERNQVLLTLWKRLSVMCGPDWAHNNSLINGNLPSQEVIGNMLFWPGFSRNLLLAAKQVEGTLAGFKDKIKRVERDLYKEYQALEQTMEVRTRKLERIEESWEKMKLKMSELETRQLHEPGGSRTPRTGRTPEISKLKGENRLLKAELQLLQQQQSHHHLHQRRDRNESRASGYSSIMSAEAAGPTSLDGGNGAVGVPARGSSMRRNRTFELHRHHSSGIVEHLASMNANMNVHMNGDVRSMRSNSISSRTSALTQTERERGLMVPAGPFNVPANGNFPVPPPREAPPAPPSNASGSDIASLTAVSIGGPGQEKWIHRLRELERRLKAEREARLLDRSGARKRLEERDAVNEELRRELERERVRKGLAAGPDEAEAGYQGSGSDGDGDGDSGHAASEGLQGTATRKR